MGSETERAPGSRTIPEPASAVPAFVGFTERAIGDAGDAIGGAAVRITSLLEFERHFGGPAVPTLDVQLGTGAAGTVSCSFEPPALRHLLHPSLRLYFDNGGGPCYVTSAGSFGPGAPHDAAASLLAGLEAVDSLDDVTLLVAPEAVRCDDDGFAAVVQAMLAQCARRDRFAILDVQRGDGPLASRPDDLRTERAKFGSEALRHGAAYLPFLQTLYPYPVVADAQGRAGANVVVHGPVAEGARTLAELESTGPAAHAATVRVELARHAIALPPSGAIAGLYCRTDRDRGVWKAPANERLNSIAAPRVAITAEQQENLGVDRDGGRSLNPIRAFAGRGTVVWGARTLAGNDDQWRYVSVRRLCTHLERSIVRGTRWVAFEPNGPATWTAARDAVAMFLTGQWRNGALQGAKPEHAFYVHCGLGETMTAQDVADGRLLVEIGLSVVRPAEFIVLRIEQRTAPDEP